MDASTGTTRQQSLGDVIRTQRSSIIAAWEVAVVALPLPSQLSEPMLRDEMPEVVDKIADLVGAQRSPSAAPAEPGESHALQRLGIGFELAHLLFEYSVLRNCILEAAARQLTLGLEDLIALNQAIDAVANHSVQRFSEASERLLKALDFISAQALHSRNLDELLRRLLDVMMSTSRAVDSVAILLADGGVLKVRAAAGVIAERDPRFTIAIGEGFSGSIAARREPRLSRSAANDPLVKSEFIKLRGIQALYGVPLVEVDCIGVAHMGSLTVQDFTQEEKVLFQAMATRATAAIVHTQLLERLETEHSLLVSTVGQMPIGVIIRDAAGRLIVANKAAARMMHGQIPESLPGGRSQTWRLFDREGRERAIDEWPMARALDGNEVIREEMTMETLAGAPRRTIEASAVPIRDNEGRTVAAVTVFEDVTARREAERERDIYISSMSHDLRTPLSVIQMTAGLLLKRDSARDVEEARALTRIFANSQRMGRLIQQLLDFARSRHAGGIPITRRRVDLVALGRQLIESLQTDEVSGRVRLHAPAAVVGNWDPDRLSQILQNLIGNALQHGRPDVPVDVDVSADERDAFLQVSNASKSPIPPALLPHIFDPFRRGELGGLGLGLYICQQIAEAHGAHIEVASDEDRTTFTVRLPRCLPEDGAG